MGEIFKSPFEVVMIIDDTEADMYITNRILVKKNFAKKVLQFSMADDALEYLRENEKNRVELPQVIFVDIHMPKKTGFEFLKEYNTFPKGLKNQCKVYMISSSIHESDIVQSRQDKNIIGFLEKPFTMQFLENIVSGELKAGI